MNALILSASGECGPIPFFSIQSLRAVNCMASEPVNAAAKLNAAAQTTAASGLRTRVPTIVAIEFAES